MAWPGLKNELSEINNSLSHEKQKCQPCNVKSPLIKWRAYSFIQIIKGEH